MKRYRYPVVVLVLGLLLGFMLRGVPVGRAGPAINVHAGSSGDANGDGVLDIADAVYTLFHLFKGGPAPVACADSPEILERVAAIEKDNLDLRTSLQTIAIAVNELAFPCRDRVDRFVDNGDGTVTDTCTGLMWQNENLSAGNRSWDAANEFIAGMDLGGHTDWRMPTADEFATIYREGWQIPIHPIFFFSGGWSPWTATLRKGNPGGAVVFTFDSSFRANDFRGKTDQRQFSAVRTIQPDE